MQKRLEPLKRATCPFAEKPGLPNPTTWVEPEVASHLPSALQSSERTRAV